MLKFIGLIIIAAASGGMGFAFGRDLKTRLEHMGVLKKMMMMLNGEIKYAKEPLPEAFRNISGRMEEPFSVFLKNIAAEMDEYNGRTFKEIWGSHIEEDLESTALSDKDKEYLNTLGENMGYLDNEMQQNTIALYLEQLELEIDELQSTLGAKIKVYQCLGVMAGLFLVLVLI